MICSSETHLHRKLVFDNHPPLFHILTWPLVKAVGERVELLQAARLAMLPLCGLTVLCVWLLGCSLFSRRAGLWAAVLIALMPSFLSHSIEFRTDVLWMTTWMLALVVLLCGPPTRSRAFLFGLLLGVTASVSVKTVLLGVALAGATLATLWVLGRSFSWKQHVQTPVVHAGGPEDESSEIAKGGQMDEAVVADPGGRAVEDRKAFHGPDGGKSPAGDPRGCEDEGLESLESCQVFQPRIAQQCLGQVQFPQAFELRQMACAAVPDAGMVKVQRPEVYEHAQVGKSRVGEPGAAVDQM